MIVWLLVAFAIVAVILIALRWRGGLWDFVVRLRTWLLGIAGTAVLILPDLMAVLPEILRSPELAALLTPQVRAYTGVIALVLVVWSRPRPASRAADVEVQVKQEIKAMPPHAVPSVEVKAGTVTKAVIR